MELKLVLFCPDDQQGSCRSAKPHLVEQRPQARLAYSCRRLSSNFPRLI